MEIRLSPRMWQSCLADQHYDFVRAALYIGYSMLEISSVVRNPALAGERLSVIDVANKLGMTDDDKIILDPKIRP